MLVLQTVARVRLELRLAQVAAAAVTPHRMALQQQTEVVKLSVDPLVQNGSAALAVQPRVTKQGTDERNPQRDTGSQRVSQNGLSEVRARNLERKRGRSPEPCSLGLGTCWNAWRKHLVSGPPRRLKSQGIR